MSFATSKILPFLLCLFVYNSFAQNELQTFTKGNGLVSSTILVTKVDSRGIVWLGTPSGISAFTSGSWVPVKSISDNNGYNQNIGRVTNIFETRKGEIWIASDKGIFIFNGKHWTYFNDNENEDFVISDIFEDRSDRIWVIYEKKKSLKDIGDLGFSLVEGVIQMYNGFQWIKFPGEIGGSAAVSIGEADNYFTSHIQDTEGNIWVTNLDGTYKFDGKKWTEYEKEQLPSDICNKVIESSKKEIWVATKYGVARNNGDEWIVYEKPRGLNGNVIVNIFEDNEARIWVATKKDHRFKYLCVFDDGKWKAFSRDQLKLKGEVVRILDFEDQVVAFSKRGITSFNGKKWTNLVNKYSIKDDNFAELLLARDKTIWFTGRNGLYQLSEDGLEKMYSPENGWKVTTNYESKKGKMLVGTEKQGIFIIDGKTITHYNEDNGLPDNYIKKTFEDKENNIWIVTKGGISLIK